MARTFTLSLTIFVLFASGLTAQIAPCFLGDDGFANLPCCQFVQQVNLPNFPGIQVGGRHACIRDCNLEAQAPLSISMSPPNFIACDLAIIQIGITPAAALAPGYSGFLLAKYSRTWTEPSTTGAQRQVWRFLVNGELQVNATSIGLAGCPIPLSAPNTGNTVHWWGSLDYACEVTPVAVGFRIRMDLNHGPNCLQYAPWTTYAGALPAGAPDRSYHIVAPGNFAFAPVPVPAGFYPAEAVRSMAIGAAGIACLAEARANANIQNVNQNCLCSPVLPVVGPWTHQNVAGNTFCNGAANFFVSVPLGGTPFPTGFVTLSLGSYIPAAGGGFPDNRDVLVHWGVLQYQDACTNNFPFHIVHGVSTTNVPGFIFTPGPVAAPFTVFMDLANHKNPFQAFAVPGGVPVFGSLSYADAVWNLNL